jgi:hypothetical protein
VHLDLQNWDQTLPGFLDRWNPKFVVVVYCYSSSCGISHEIAERLKQNQIPQVYDLKGGWESLQHSNLVQTIKGSSKQL